MVCGVPPIITKKKRKKEKEKKEKALKPDVLHKEMTLLEQMCLIADQYPLPFPILPKAHFCSGAHSSPMCLP